MVGIGKDHVSVKYRINRLGGHDVEDDTLGFGADNTAEQVALKLFKMIAALEDQHIPGVSEGQNMPDRRYILTRYAECLRAVKSPFTFVK